MPDGKSPKFSEHSVGALAGSEYACQTMSNWIPRKSRPERTVVGFGHQIRYNERNRSGPLYPAGKIASTKEEIARTNDLLRFPRAATLEPGLELLGAPLGRDKSTSTGG
jgi:hypothetical protein